jgi:histidinol-phosphate aminotransferase
VLADALKCLHKTLGHDLDAMLAAIEPNTVLMFIANPNNPTGTFIDATLLYAALKKKVPANVLVVGQMRLIPNICPDILRVDTAGWISKYSRIWSSRAPSPLMDWPDCAWDTDWRTRMWWLMNRVRQPIVNSLAQTAAAALPTMIS